MGGIGNAMRITADQRHVLRRLHIEGSLMRAQFTLSQRVAVTRSAAQGLVLVHEQGQGVGWMAYLTDEGRRAVRARRRRAA